MFARSLLRVNALARNAVRDYRSAFGGNDSDHRRAGGKGFPHFCGGGVGRGASGRRSAGPATRRVVSGSGPPEVLGLTRTFE
ncbi:hypothetical protein GCM10009634_17600 [Saccharothrix xinjiangensis]